LFAYPKQAEVDRTVPKAKLYAHGKVPRRVKECFVAQVGEVVWKYKLSPETINLPASEGIMEIQVFELSLRTPELDDAVLLAIDRAIPFPMVFQLAFESQVRYSASYKRPSEVDPAKWVIEGRFETGYTERSSATLEALPVALDLASLYHQIVRRHVPLPPRPGESIADHVARYQALEARRRQHRQLQARLALEKQFNRKVELNAALRSLTQEVEALEKA